MTRYNYIPFPYSPPPEIGAVARTPVAIVGAGPVGLAMAIDLALRGVKSIVVDDNDVVSVGSRAICWSKRTLEIFDRLGVGERMVDKGVTWKVGRNFHGDNEIYNFDLLPEEGHKMPAFINLQQYYVEEYLVERCGDFPDLIDLRWKNWVNDVENGPDGAKLAVSSPDGDYTIEADWVIACDGVRSTVRQCLGLDFAGRIFEERFLIADIEMEADFPSERWFWFDPPFHSGKSALLHKQPDNIYRIDLQLTADADPDIEKQPENVIPRIKEVVGDRPFEIDWVSVYTFQCRRLERFVHDRVIFAGDSAHIVSPFGARGGNGGIQDIDNLGWKLELMLNGQAGPELIESYNEERVHGADENIMNSSRSTNFMTPKSPTEAIFRAAVLDLAGDLDFARRLVNSGRLSLPCSLENFPLQSAASEPAALAPGSPCLDAPLTQDGKSSWLLNELADGFTLLCVDCEPPEVDDVVTLTISTGSNSGGEWQDAEGHVATRYGSGLMYLIRPDAHVAAVFRNPRLGQIKTARHLAMGFAS